MLHVKLLLISILMIGTCASLDTCGTGKECVPSNLCSVGTEPQLVFLVETDEGTLCQENEVCCPIQYKIDKPKIGPNDCGYQNVKGVGFENEKANENQANFGEFPWMVAIFFKDYPPGEELDCGGSLITPQVVLTSFDCTRGGKMNAIKVRAGEWDMSNKDELYPHQERRVVKIISHESYKRHIKNNIALMFLDSPFELAPNVKTVCLPPANKSFDFQRCYATGWGTDTLYNVQKILKKIDLPIIPNAQCAENLKKIHSKFELHSSLLCAGGEGGKDTCRGDSGSPLVCPMNNVPNRFFQVGIVSGGFECGLKNVPALYTSVSQLRTWIDEKLANKDINSTYFRP